MFTVLPISSFLLNSAFRRRSTCGELKTLMIIVRRPSPFLRAWYRDRVRSSLWIFSPRRIRRPYHWWHPTITLFSALSPSYRWAKHKLEYQVRSFIPMYSRTPSYCRIESLVDANQRLTVSPFDLIRTLRPSFWTFGSDLPETAAASAWNNTQNLLCM